MHGEIDSCARIIQHGVDIFLGTAIFDRK